VHNLRDFPRMARRPRKQEKGARTTHWSKARLDQLIEQATVDAHGESEQRTAFFTMLEEHLDLPFEAQVLGVPVMIEAIDLTEADEIVALCRRGRERQRIPILAAHDERRGLVDLAVPRRSPGLTSFAVPTSPPESTPEHLEEGERPQSGLAAPLYPYA